MKLLPEFKMGVISNVSIVTYSRPLELTSNVELMELTSNVELMLTISLFMTLLEIGTENTSVNSSVNSSVKMKN